MAFSKKYLIQQQIYSSEARSLLLKQQVSVLQLRCFTMVSLKLIYRVHCRVGSLVRFLTVQDCSKVNVGHPVCFTGRDETIQPAKPSFLEYFEQKEKEANIHNDGGGKGQNNGDNRKLPGVGDLEVVS